MLDVLPSKSIIFIDSNIFIYHFLGTSESCKNFLNRIKNDEITGYTSVLVLTEVLHRLMLIEAKEKYKLTGKNVLKYLKKHPEDIQTLTKYQEAVEKIPEFNVKIIPLTVTDILQSKNLRIKYGLLTNDSINLSFMITNSIVNIATRDSDFGNIREIKVWKP